MNTSRIKQVLPFCLKKMNFPMKKSKSGTKVYRLVIWGGGGVHNKQGGGLDCAQYFIKWGGGGANKMELMVKKSKNRKIPPPPPPTIRNARVSSFIRSKFFIQIFLAHLGWGHPTQT